MNEKILTATEIDDLLSVFKGGRDGSVLSDVESLDLERPNRIPKGILETLEIRHEQGARVMGRGLRAALGCDIDVSLQGVEQERFQTFKERIEEPCCGFVVDMRPLRFPGYLVIDFEFAYACIDRLLGGTGAKSGAGRDLTSTEIAVLHEITEPILSAHAGVWERYMKLTPSIRRATSVPRFMREIRRDDAVLVAEYRFKGFADRHGFRLAMPLPGLEGLLQYRRDRSTEEKEHTEAAAQDARVELQEHMTEVDVDVAVRIGGAALTVREVLDLEPGDVVLLDRDVGEPLDLIVEGRPKFEGQLLRSGRRLVFRLKTEPDELTATQDAQA